MVRTLWLQQYCGNLAGLVEDMITLVYVSVLNSRSEDPPHSVQSPAAETPPDSLSESVPSRRPTIRY